MVVVNKIAKILMDRIFVLVEMVTNYMKTNTTVQRLNVNLS